jgi:hypothetical protein
MTFRTRRSFLGGAAAAGAGLSLAGLLQGLAGCAPKVQRSLPKLVKDPQGMCDLPSGFTYTVISPYGETMSDAHTVPDYHDGMGCFAGPAGSTILVRNHEISTYFPTDPPSPAPAHAYDPAASGGTTTIWLNERMELERHYLSLTGTIRNCGGGTTPWGTWISCEEAGSEGWLMGKRHGYNFEGAFQSRSRRLRSAQRHRLSNGGCHRWLLLPFLAEDTRAAGARGHVAGAKAGRLDDQAHHPGPA